MADSLKLIFKNEDGGWFEPQHLIETTTNHPGILCEIAFPFFIKMRPGQTALKKTFLRIHPVAIPSYYHVPQTHILHQVLLRYKFHTCISTYLQRFFKEK